VTTLSDPVSKAGLRKGDLIESISGIPLTGRAQMQAARWLAHPGETMRLGVRRADGTHTTVAIPLTGFQAHLSLGESVFVIVLHLVVPLFCLVLGCWAALARPADLNAWLILILLSYPQSFIAISVFNWWPDWISLRLFWHLTVEIIAPAALIWLGLRFPERSRIDLRWPSLKWLFLGIQLVGLLAEFASDDVIWPNAEVLLPLAGRIKLMGVMILGPKLSEEACSKTDLRLLASVGAQVGLGLEINDLAHSLAQEAARGERMAREVEIAREVQQRLFPQIIPDVPGLDLAGRCRPALAVGGDYYDMIELERLPARARQRRRVGEGNWRGSADGWSAGFSAWNDRQRFPRSGPHDLQVQPPGLRLFHVESLCHLLLRHLRSRSW
jgi:hypothetical protein